ncbi:hypothetical protein BOX15_Mlig014477g2, partial [Macrostomum lignano]
SMHSARSGRSDRSHRSAPAHHHRGGGDMRSSSGRHHGPGQIHSQQQQQQQHQMQPLPPPLPQMASAYRPQPPPNYAPPLPPTSIAAASMISPYHYQPPTDSDNPNELGGLQQHQQQQQQQQQANQDDNWGETNTALTGATSETGMSADEMARYSRELDAAAAAAASADAAGFDCGRAMATVLSVTLGLAAFISPLVMVVLPKAGAFTWELKECSVACEGKLISLAFRLLILLVATWCLFFRRGRASMPRVYIFRVLILFLIFVITFAFWLFYGVRVWQYQESDYSSIVEFAVGLTDALLFVHYLGVVLLEIRHLQARYAIKVLRSPDGESHIYPVGELSIQRAAVLVLQQYAVDFNAFNPYLEQAYASARNRSAHRRSYRFYDVDQGSQANGSAAAGGDNGGGGNGGGHSSSGRHQRRGSAAGGGGGGGSRSAADRFYDECEYERRLRKRRARLVTAAEEAFAHVRRATNSELMGPQHLPQHMSQQQQQPIGKPMSAYEAAQTVFPTMLRALQKYLRITKQQPRYTTDMVLHHLTNCIHYGLSAKAFIERYLTQGPVVEDPRAPAGRKRQTWTLLCDCMPSRSLDDGVQFCLRQGDVSLFCTVKRIPFFSLGEEVFDNKRHKFVLRLNSETSV